jgi:hypothetical protein
MYPPPPPPKEQERAEIELRTVLSQRLRQKPELLIARLHPTHKQGASLIFVFLRNGENVIENGLA